MASDAQPPRYTSKDCCTPCWYDSCGSCRGGTCACQRYNHPPGQQALTDGGITYPRTRLYSQDYKQVLFDTARDEGDPAEWFKASEHDWLGMVKDFSETWKSRWSGRIEKQDDGSTRTHDAGEFLKFRLCPSNPAI